MSEKPTKCSMPGCEERGLLSLRGRPNRKFCEEHYKAARRNGDRPVATKRLAAELGGLDIWNIWYHLRRLEERGLVHRPEGPKSGWAVAA